MSEEEDDATRVGGKEHLRGVVVPLAVQNVQDFWLKGAR